MFALNFLWFSIHFNHKICTAPPGSAWGGWARGHREDCCKTNRSLLSCGTGPVFNAQIFRNSKKVKKLIWDIWFFDGTSNRPLWKENGRRRDHRWFGARTWKSHFLMWTHVSFSENHVSFRWTHVSLSGNHVSFRWTHVSFSGHHGPVGGHPRSFSVYDVSVSGNHVSFSENPSMKFNPNGMDGRARKNSTAVNFCDHSKIWISTKKRYPKKANVSNEKSRFFADENFCSMRKFKILHRCRTIKGPMKNPAPHKILQRNENLNEIGFSVVKYYIPAKSGSFEFCRFEPLNRIRMTKKSIRIRIDFFKSFEFSNSQHRPNLNVSNFAQFFPKMWINFLQNNYTIFYDRMKKVW